MTNFENLVSDLSNDCELPLEEAIEVVNYLLDLGLIDLEELGKQYAVHQAGRS